MTYVLRVAAVLAMAGCTASNPRSCMDGLCTDEEFPFCDVDGSISGTPQMCVAVLCTPSEIGGCRGDSELVCNAKGNDYDLVDCPHGCAGNGCKECSANDHCPTAKPVCDTGGTCRGCVIDDECASTVCDAGMCVAEASILYASNAGSSNSACTRTAPCTSARAISLARVAAVPPLIRLLPGAYAQGLLLDMPSTAVISIVASGATVVAGDGLTVKNGASVAVRGLAIMGLNFTVLCGEEAQPRATLALRDVAISAGANNTNLITVTNCTLTMDVADVNLNASTGNAITVATDGTFDGDRLRVHGETSSQIAGVGSKMEIRITNSLLENVTTFLSVLGSSGPPSVLAYGYNTMLLGSGSTLDCAGGALRSIAYDNNVIVGANVASVVTDTGCNIANNVLFPQAMPRPNNILADPELVNPAMGDLHLKATSPAVDAAASTLAFPTPQPDYEGTARPQGAKPDIGAYERKP